jgi:hypothetical protein
MKRRLQVVIKKTDTDDIKKIQAQAFLWLESFPTPPSPLSAGDRNARLEALQEGVRSSAAGVLLKPKKKQSPGRLSGPSPPF